MKFHASFRHSIKLTLLLLLLTMPSSSMILQSGEFDEDALGFNENDIEQITAYTGQNVELLCEAALSTKADKVQFITPNKLKLSNLRRSAMLLANKYSLEQDYDAFWKLTVRDILPNKDSGLYECWVNSEHIQSYNVSIQVPPRITALTVFPEDSIHEHDDVIVHCEATGDPLPSIILMTHLRNGSLYESIGGPVLIIRKISANGIRNVTCIADNGLSVKDTRTKTIIPIIYSRKTIDTRLPYRQNRIIVVGRKPQSLNHRYMGSGLKNEPIIHPTINYRKSIRPSRHRKHFNFTTYVSTSSARTSRSMVTSLLLLSLITITVSSSLL